MCKPCDIRHVGIVSEIVSRDMGVDSTMFVRGAILSEEYEFFIKENFVIQYREIAKGIAVIHIFGLPLKSLAETRNFVIGTMGYILREKPIDSLIAFCKKKDMRLRFLVRETGGKKVGELPDDIIFSWNFEDLEEIERRAK